MSARQGTMMLNINTKVELPPELVLPGLRSVAFVEYRLSNPDRHRQPLLDKRGWQSIATSPRGDELIGRQDIAETDIDTAEPAVLLSSLSGDANPHPGIRSVGIWVDDIDAATEAAWEMDAADVFDGGPVGLLELRIPALRWADNRFYYFMAVGDGYQPLVTALATSGLS